MQVLEKRRGIFTADGQDVAVAFVFVFFVIQNICHHHCESIGLVGYFQTYRLYSYVSYLRRINQIVVLFRTDRILSLNQMIGEINRGKYCMSIRDVSKNGEGLSRPMARMWP